MRDDTSEILAEIMGTSPERFVNLTDVQSLALYRFEDLVVPACQRVEAAIFDGMKLDQNEQLAANHEFALAVSSEAKAEEATHPAPAVVENSEDEVLAKIKAIHDRSKDV